MNIKDINYYYKKLKFGEDVFHDLMKRRIHNILMISNFYEAYTFEKDGMLFEQIFGEYQQLNLSVVPKINVVPTGEEALLELKKHNYDIIVSLPRIGKVTPFDIAQKYKSIPFYLLINNKSDLFRYKENLHYINFIEKIFFWIGDPKLFVAMVKLLEDKINLAHDTKLGMTHIIIYIENNIEDYSAILPNLYEEVMIQTQLVIRNELNEANKKAKMRERPKIIHCDTWENAKKIIKKYEENLLTIITNDLFLIEDHEDCITATEIINCLRRKNETFPILVIGNHPIIKSQCDEKKYGFVCKKSKNLFSGIRNFMKESLGFGQFVFRFPNGEIYSTAENFVGFINEINKIPDEILSFHVKKNHFSTWLIAHGEINVAKIIKPLSIKDFDSINALREFLLKIFHDAQSQKYRGKIIDFNKNNLKAENQVVLLKQGSLGGKGRGIAFMNALLAVIEFDKVFPDVDVKIPQTAIIGTDEFDEFIEKNNILSKIKDKSDSEIDNIFINGELSNELKSKIEIYLEYITNPLAVRSSSLLEDSQVQPFAGVYRTFMLPNNEKDIKKRFQHLQNAIKLIFASVFLTSARQYKQVINNYVDEEKMAVIIQEIVGNNIDENHFAPLISGVGQTYNYYPKPPMKNDDFLVTLGVGLGKAVVDGNVSFRYSPNHPKLEYYKPNILVENMQKEFFALNLNHNNFNLLEGEDSTLQKIRLSKAYIESAFFDLSSIWDYQNERFLDAKYLQGPRVLTFRNFTLYNEAEINKILNNILEIGKISTGSHIEIEFSIKKNLKENSNRKYSFYLLQLRPLTMNSEEVKINFNDIDKKAQIIFSSKVIGNGLYRDIKNLIFLPPEKFEVTKTREMKTELEKMNRLFSHDNRYILIGPGRWGTKDRFLGIPVLWNQINNAGIIVEYQLDEKAIDISLGSHFFHNLVSSKVGYITIPINDQNCFIDWEWLKSINPEWVGDFFVLLTSKSYFNVKIDGKNGYGIISKPT